MPEHIHSVADASPEDHALELNSAGSGHLSVRAGMFSLRRAGYFYETGLDEAGHGTRRPDMAEGATAEAAGKLQQADCIRGYRDQVPRR